jgi:hypothetical protein
MRGLIAAGSLQPATERLCLRKQGFSMGGAPQPIGSVPTSFGLAIPMCGSKRTASSSPTDRCGPQPGMTAGIDLALALIEEDLGLEAARTIARRLVLYHRRARGQSQFSSLLELAPKSDRIQTVLTYARRNLAGAAERRRSCPGRTSLAAPVQPGLPGGNRPDTSEGDREPPPGGGARADGRHQPHH